jgi:hypothetical protein
MKKTQVLYVPGGILHSIATTDKPTIETVQGGVFVKMPDPEHMNEVAKSWFWIKPLPPDFFVHLQDTLCDTAHEILSSTSLGLNQVGIEILQLRHSKIATPIPGGLLLVISAFLKLSQMYPNLKLVLETFNGKNKGLTAQVDVSMSLDLQKTADDLEACIFDFDSIFKVVSDLCNSCTDLEERISTCSFGFRTVHKNRTTSANVHCCINKQDNFQQSADCQIYPMAFLHPAIAPFLQFLDSTSPVVRVQMYLEPWSAHKNCNTKYSIKSTGQNLKKAIEGKSLNVSVLKAGLPNLAETLDASFRNWQRTSGTRFEVAVRLKLKHFSNPAQTLFDIGDGLNTAWAHLESSFTFSDIHSVVMHSSLCTAATLLGYRASLDALNDNALEANQQSSIFEYVRYMNAIIHSIPNGRFILNNPKLFLANIGFQAGRPAALTPTLPRLVS